MMISTWERGSEEYAKLKAVADMLNAYGKQTYWVEDTWFDFGQEWLWTTILAEDKQWGAYQALTPRQEDEILIGNIEDVLGVIAEILAKEDK